MIDIIPSRAKAAFVEFDIARYRHLIPDWRLFGTVSRHLDTLPDDRYDLIICDCLPIHDRRFRAKLFRGKGFAAQAILRHPLFDDPV